MAKDLKINTRGSMSKDLKTKTRGSMPKDLKIKTRGSLSKHRRTETRGSMPKDLKTKIRRSMSKDLKTKTSHSLKSCILYQDVKTQSRSVVATLAGKPLGCKEDDRTQTPLLIPEENHQSRLNKKKIKKKQEKKKARESPYVIHLFLHRPPPLASSVVFTLVR